MVSYAHILPLVVCFFILMSLRRFWLCIGRFGSVKEVSRRAPELIQFDLLAAALAVMPFLLAIADWIEIVLPRTTGPISTTLAVLISFACALASALMVSKAEARIAGSWAGTRESALRTLAALQIIDAAELAYSLRFSKQFQAEARLISSSEIHAEEWEAKK